LIGPVSEFRNLSPKSGRRVAGERKFAARRKRWNNQRSVHAFIEQQAGTGGKDQAATMPSCSTVSVA
jgi:hypothetical protein